MIYLQIVDGAVVSVFTSPQDASALPGLTEAADDDQRALDFLAGVQPFAIASAAYLDTVRTTRETILNRLAGIGVAAVIGADTATAAAVATARTSLLNITTDATVLAATDLAGLKAAVLAIYKAIVAAAPAALVKAFYGMDQ